MKKVFLSLAVLCSVALVSCGGGNGDKKDSDSTKVEDNNAPQADNTQGTTTTTTENVEEIVVNTPDSDAPVPATPATQG